MKTYEEKAYSALKRIKEETEAQRKKKMNVIKILLLVTGLCLAAAAGIGIWQSGIFKRPDFSTPGNTLGKNEFTVTDPQNNTSPAESEINLPVSADMAACLVYKGNVYTQSTAAYDFDLTEIERLMGEYIGEAKNILDCFSTQEDWSTEFASTYSGSVYKVNGYSEEFRLCIYEKVGDGYHFDLLDNYDESRLNTGADLFEDRLHIKGNVEGVNCRVYDDWNHGKFDSMELTKITEEQFEEFLNKLCDSPFEHIDPIGNPDFYEAEIQGLLYLHMKDGTCVELRLIEGGYVGLQNFGWFFVKMPGEIFDSVLAACQ